MPTEKPRKNKGTEPVYSLPPDDVLFGRSAAMQELRQRAEKICGTDITVLLIGDGGTGKEVLARWIHEHSSARNGQFIKVNCAAVPGALLESELFGYENGAFTGAHASKPGRVEQAHNGTLFLDQISDLEMGLQSKLLHFLQDGSFSRIGDDSSRTVNARVICTTNQDLDHEMASGRFRVDLYYRINVFQFRLPKLRERREDIAVLAEYFRVQHEKQFAKESGPLEPQMLNYLRNLDWPGNLRELSNAIARHVLIGGEAKIVQESVTRYPDPTPGSSRGAGVIPLKRMAKEVVRERERSFILEALQANQWNRRETAKALKISYRTLIYKIRESGLTSKHSRLNATSRADAAGSSLPPMD